MKLQVQYARSALKGLRTMRKPDAKALAAKINDYAADPFGSHTWAKRLTGVDGLRIRHGDYRAICRIDDEALVVVAIGHRSEVYR